MVARVRCRSWVLHLGVRFTNLPHPLGFFLGLRKLGPIHRDAWRGLRGRVEVLIQQRKIVVEIIQGTAEAARLGTQDVLHRLLEVPRRIASPWSTFSSGRTLTKLLSPRGRRMLDSY